MSCIKKYFYNAANVGFRLNQIFAVDGVGSLTFNFPFMMVAFADGDRPPRDLPIASVAAQFTYRQKMEVLAQQMACANCNPGVAQGAVTYSENPIVPGYSKYLNNFLGNIAWTGSVTSGVDEMPLNLQAFLTALAQVSTFWKDQNTLVSTTPFLDVEQIVDRLTKQTDLRLWLPPGIYDIDNAVNPPNMAELIADVANFPNGYSIIVVELKSIE